MFFVIIAALFSVAVSVALKYFKQQHFSIITLLCCNYIAAGILALVFLPVDFQQLHWQQTWWLIALMAVLLPGIFYCLDYSLQQAGLIKTEIAQRLSVIITIVTSGILYHEVFSGFKIIGILLGITAILLMILGKSADNKPSSKAWYSLLLVWIGYAVIDLLFKYTATLKLPFATTLTGIFLAAAIVMLIVHLQQKQTWHIPAIFAGLLLGVFNFGNIYFYLTAHRHLADNPSIVFAGMNILVVTFGIILAVVLFKERLNLPKILGGCCAVAAVYCLMQSM